MAWTNHFKKKVGDLFATGANQRIAGVHAALGAVPSGGTAVAEIAAANGYARKQIPVADLTVAADGSSIAFNKAVTIYTPNTGNAVDATHIAFFDAAVAGNQLTGWFQYPDIAAPRQGQPVQIANGFRITV